MKSSLSNGLLVAALAMAIHGSAMGMSSYELEAMGRDEAAALGNLKMAALREQLGKSLAQDEIKKNAKILRNSVFLKKDDFVTSGPDLVFTKEGKRTKVHGTVTVDDEKLMSVLGGLKLHPKPTASAPAPAAPAPAGGQPA
nr:hypothetical protein [Succinivibrionaceae bacterium]